MIEELYQSFENEKLCDIIITYRLLNSFQENAKSAMIELAKRSKDPSYSFDYESYINSKIKEFNEEFDLKFKINNNLSVFSLIDRNFLTK